MLTLRLVMKNTGVRRRLISCDESGRLDLAHKPSMLDNAPRGVCHVGLLCIAAAQEAAHQN